MRLNRVQDALKRKISNINIQKRTDAEVLISCCRGLWFHVWEYEDRVWALKRMCFKAGRSQDIEGNYELVISEEILSWPDMLPEDDKRTKKRRKAVGVAVCCAAVKFPVLRQMWLKLQKRGL